MEDLVEMLPGQTELQKDVLGGLCTGHVAVCEMLATECITGTLIPGSTQLI